LQVAKDIQGIYYGFDTANAGGSPVLLV